MNLPTETVLFTRQRHDAKRAGLHFDYRMVVGDKAYSWASHEDLPDMGKAVILHEQPVHTADYALSPRIEIPDGQYGAGVTTLDWVRKAKLVKKDGPKPGQAGSEYFTLHVDGANGREKYLLKHLPKYGEKMWLFKRLPIKDEDQDALQKSANTNLALKASRALDPYTNAYDLISKEVESRKKKSVKKNRYLTKIAAKETKPAKPASELRPHQAEALSRLDSQDGIILDHSTGSGKTKTFLKAIEKRLAETKDGHALVLAPASLISNIDKEIEKHDVKIDRSRLIARSYEKASNESEELAKKKIVIAVADEAQKLRNPGTKRHSTLSDIIATADKRVLASATPSYNHISDISPLINLAAGERVLPEGKKPFEDRYVSKTVEQPSLLKRITGHGPVEISGLKRKAELQSIVGEYVHHYDLRDDPAAKSKFPSKEEHVISVEMSPKQHQVYKYLEGRLPLHLRLKVRYNLPLDKKESAQLNAFSTGVRQVSNSIKPFVSEKDRGSAETSPKIRTAVSSLTEHHKADKNFRGLVYSNYLDAGLLDYSKELEKAKIPHTVFTGSLSAKEKDAAVAAYNKGEVPVLLISSSGAEGLDLKGTKLIQTLEPHFNQSKIDQVMGRGVRYMSHEHLPENERHVKIEHYLSVMPKEMFGKKSHSIDEYLKHNSINKSDLSDQLRELVKQKQRRSTSNADQA